MPYQNEDHLDDSRPSGLGQTVSVDREGVAITTVDYGELPPFTDEERAGLPRHYLDTLEDELRQP